MIDLRKMMEEYRYRITIKGSVDHAFERLQKKILDNAGRDTYGKGIELYKMPSHIYVRLSEQDKSDEIYIIEMGYEVESGIKWITEENVIFGLGLSQAIDNIFFLKKILEEKGYEVDSVEPEEKAFMCLKVKL